ncbi:hypothetical protein PLEOSDRAFT_1085374 [Pleurotus ostreatus PC15]|uniref:Uncharacterized protein n=1 Tax=Pleurotus ostreatus (strain PC15) TaxID=1137138 RepID=A0A067NDJ9_PLEO1|nr:hypothetical protein PLEOSDRAFT_1085374 [Pleurotus ostreatus PC15]
MRAWYSPNTPRPVAWLAFVEVLVRNFGVLRPMDNVVIVDASVTPAGTLSSSIHVFRGQNGGDWILTITIDDDDDNLVSRRGFEHQVVPFNPQDYMEIDPFHNNIFKIIMLFFIYGGNKQNTISVSLVLLWAFARSGSEGKKARSGEVGTKIQMRLSMHWPDTAITLLTSDTRIASVEALRTAAATSAIRGGIV